MAAPATECVKGRDLQPGHVVKYTGYWYRIENFTGAGVIDNELSPDLGASYRTAWGHAANGRPKVLLLLDDQDYVARAAGPSRACELPRRVARVTHALLARTADNDGGLVTTTEVCEYDSPVDAPTVDCTRRALHRAMRYGLADRAGWRLWFPTGRAWAMRAALEAAARGQEAEEEP